MKTDEALEVLSEYSAVAWTPQFAEYEKEYARKTQDALAKAYASGRREPEVVDVIQQMTNNLSGFISPSTTFTVTTDAIFIHGSKSQVRYQCYGRSAQREFGDLIFILSVIHHGKKRFEKFTITQFKNEKAKKRRTRWYLGGQPQQEQLFLLSRFPRFKGVVSSLVPEKYYSLEDLSGCLGTYGLLFKPGDFSLVSASALDSHLGDRKSVYMDDIAWIRNTGECFGWPLATFPWLRHLFLESWVSPLSLMKKRQLGLAPSMILSFPWGILGNDCHASNVHEFSAKYLRGYVGELTYSDFTFFNAPAHEFLLDLLLRVSTRGGKERDFCNRFLRYEAANSWRATEDMARVPESGGMGIVHTEVNLEPE